MVANDWLMEQKLKQQLGEMIFTILALQVKLEEATNKLTEKEGVPSQISNTAP